MRVMVVLLLLLLVVLLPETVAARPAVWKQKRTVVYDYTGPEWQVQEAVAIFNARLPKRAPTLIYVAMTGPCQVQPRAIAVCVVPDAEIPAHHIGAVAQTMVPQGADHIRNASVWFGASANPGLRLSCHELTHALGVQAHGDWVYGDPCPYDAEAMQRLYQREPKRKHR